MDIKPNDNSWLESFVRNKNMTKTCTKCKQDKELTEFSRKKASKDGLQGPCKICAKLYVKAWYNANSDREKAKKNTYRKANPDKAYANNRTNKSRFSMGQRRAKSAGLVWDLTIEQWASLVIGKTCHYCDGPLPEVGYALDRKDNNVGYTLDNVIPCCSQCNYIKGEYLTYDEMVAVSNLLKQMRT